MIFIERIIFRVLTAGLAEMIADPAKFEKFILDGLTDEGSTTDELTAAQDEAARAREYFEANPPTVLHGYARVDGVFPCWCITLGGESTDQDWLGQDDYDSYLLDPEDDESRVLCTDDDGNRVDPKTRRWGHNFEVWTYVDHPDLCLYFYYLAKQLLAEGFSSFQAVDLDEITYTGADMAPDTRYLPSGMFVRKLAMKTSSDQHYIERLRPGVGAASSIAGGHIAEDENDATGAKSNVTVNTE